MENPQKKPIPQSLDLIHLNIKNNIPLYCSFCSEEISDSELHFISISPEFPDEENYLICKNCFSSGYYLNFFS